MCYCAFACTTWRMCGAVRECNLSIVNYCSKPSSAVAFYRSIWHVFILLSLGNVNAAAPQDGTKSEDTVFSYLKPVNGHIKTAKQRTTIQQYGDWYTGRWWMGCYILVQRGGAWAELQPNHTSPRCTKCNSPSINGRCTNFILFDVALCILKG